MLIPCNICVSPNYNGMMVEIQIRTKLQHLWATAIEVLGLYTKHNLKASQGDKRILRYMELVSALFALDEKMPISESVPASRNEIIAELKTLSDTRVLDILDALKSAMYDMKGDAARSKSYKDCYYVLALTLPEGNTSAELTVSAFTVNEFQQAVTLYKRLETDLAINTAMVSTASFDTLKKAYPNYFVDVSEFVNTVNKMLTRAT